MPGTPGPEAGGGPAAPGFVLLEEQSLRDGLQNEARLLTVAEKLELVGLLAAAGIRRIQVGSFVDPRRMPQMAGTGELVAQVQADWPHLLCSALVLNARGLERALACGMHHLSLSVSVAESHSRRNVGRAAADALDDMVALVRGAVAAGVRVRAGVQCAFGCLQEGDVDEATVLAAVKRLAAAGAAEINLADTAGLATPFQVRRLVARVRAAVPEARLSLHLHDTGGQGLANLAAGYGAGVRLFDTAAGGLGGCPFVEGVAGNVATEEAVRFFEAIGVATGVDLAALAQVVRRYEALLGRTLAGERGRAA